MLASLRWAEVLARGRSTGARTTSLLNAQSTTLNNLTLQTFFGSIRLFSSNHLHESKATRLLAVRVKHDLALLDIAIFFEETSDFDLRETRMDTSDEQVGTRIDCTIIGWRATVTLRWATEYELAMRVGKGEEYKPAFSMTVTVRRCRATSTTARAFIATSRTWRCTAITLITRSLIYATRFESAPRPQTVGGRRRIEVNSCIPS
jgi:hypothetical protein